MPLATPTFLHRNIKSMSLFLNTWPGVYIVRGTVALTGANCPGGKMKEILVSFLAIFLIINVFEMEGVEGEQKKLVLRIYMTFFWSKSCRLGELRRPQT